VVENRLIGIAGNALIMPVVPGIHLDPTMVRFDQEDQPLLISLIDLYQPVAPPPIARFAVPTKGVFAEAVQGSCNACETKDEARFWRWEESPCPDDPPPIQQPSAESRRAEPPNLTPTAFPNPIINLQNAPAAPDPTGVAAALELLAKPDLFRDITGLTENQRNALAALQSSFGAATGFSQQATNLALQAAMSKDIDKSLGSIQRANELGLISEEQKKELAGDAIRSMFGGGANAAAGPLSAGEVGELVNKAGESNAAVSVRGSAGEVSIDARSPEGTEDAGRKPLETSCGFFGTSVIHSEEELRDAVRATAIAERDN
jgi:hypothetical protein